MAHRLLIADDDCDLLSDFFQFSLKELEDFEVDTAESLDATRECIKQNSYDVVLLDVSFGKRAVGTEGFALFPEVRQALPEAEIMMYTQHDNDDFIAQARQLGTNLIVKGNTSFHELARKVGIALRRQAAKRTANENTLDLVTRCGAVYRSAKMDAVFKRALEARAQRESSVLLRGPSGAGKEVVAAVIGAHIDRAPFVAVNCATLCDTMMESQLFGHEAGSFTDCRTRHDGYFLMANGGTLFLDEVGCLSVKAQQSLLRVMETKEITRFGGKQSIKVNVRIIAATNDPLEERVANGLFRADLLQRLRAIEIHIPSLDERPEDIGPLIDCFLERYGASKGVRGIDPTCRAYLERQSWPMNARQLAQVIQNAIHRTVGDEIEIGDLPPEYIPKKSPKLSTCDANAAEGFSYRVPFQTNLDDATADFQRLYLDASLDRLGRTGNLRALAESVGLPRTNLWRRLSALGLQLGDGGLEPLSTKP